MLPHAQMFEKIKSKVGAGSCPFQLVAYWKCEQSHTDLKVDYKYNSHAMASPSPLLNLTLAVPVDGGFISMQSKPTAQCTLLHAPPPNPLTHTSLFAQTVLYSVSQGRTSRVVTCAVLSDLVVAIFL
uniref:Muniscin C-terminal domain-containing protein n=1 Tax=Timema monikensis TaxID=170555 RepID=A0A7R9HL60_9NEOP|nr:unnamed protein product [Timema monikensis]